MFQYISLLLYFLYYSWKFPPAKVVGQCSDSNILMNRQMSKGIEREEVEVGPVTTNEKPAFAEPGMTEAA